MPTVHLNGVDLYYERHGDNGAPLILVHGYTGDITDWRHQLPVFSKTHRVLVFDHRGHGRSHAPADRALYTVMNMADDVEALAEHAGFERYHLLGHSMGGAVAQEIALRSPQRLLSLILEDTGHNFALVRSEIVRKYLEDRLSVAEAHGMAAVAELPGLPPPPHATEERRAEEKARLTRMSVDGFIGAWGALQSWAGSTERLRQITARTLVICGALDGALLEPAKLIAGQIPDATLEIIPEAGHSPQYERPDLFNAAVERHLAAGIAVAGG